MPDRCVVGNCSNSNKDGVSLHKFPSDKQIANLWTEFVQSTRTDFNVPSRTSSVCSAHFTDDCFDPSYRIKKQFGITFRREVLPGKFPTIKYPHIKLDNEELKYRPDCTKDVRPIELLPAPMVGTLQTLSKTQTTGSKKVGSRGRKQVTLELFPAKIRKVSSEPPIKKGFGSVSMKHIAPEEFEGDDGVTFTIEPEGLEDENIDCEDGDDSWIVEETDQLLEEEPVECHEIIINPKPEDILKHSGDSRKADPAKKQNSDDDRIQPQDTESGEDEPSSDGDVYHVSIEISTSPVASPKSNVHSKICCMSQNMIDNREVFYKCNVCEETFTCWRNFKGHVRTHSGKRLYTCQFCEESSVRDYQGMGEQMTAVE